MSYQIGDIVPESNLPIPNEYKSGKALGLQKGQLVIVIDPSWSVAKKGEVLEIHSYASSYAPTLIRANGKTISLNTDRFATVPLKKGKAEIVDVITIYSDGVQISAKTIRVNGKTHKREDLQKTVDGNRALLKRSFVTVPEIEKPATKTALKKTKTAKK